MAKTAANSKRPKRPGPPGQDARAAERRLQSLELRIAGFSYRTIGVQTNVSVTSAFNDVQRALEELAEKQHEKTARLRSMESERLDKIQASLWASRADPKAATALLRVFDHRARLFGMYAPTKIAQTTPDGASLVQMVDLSKLTTDELRMLREIQSKAGVVQMAEAS